MKTAVIILLLFTCATSMAQVNLVMNPSLEQYSICPNAVDEIKYANYWMSLDTIWSPPDWASDPPGVPEYCNICAIGHTPYTVPYASTYYHYPRTGTGMAQVQMFYNEYESGADLKRDYLQGHLSAPLVAGQSYCVTFYVVQEGGSYYDINHIGAYLDDGTIDTTTNFGLPQTEDTPQIIENAIISDTVNWTKIQGSFVATGTERLITIGNFTDTGHMNFAPVSDTSLHNCVCLAFPEYSWYLVDDISVIASNAVANAGPDRVIDSAGDTVLIGDTLDTYLPTYWYANGVVIDSNTSGIYVHPDTTTSYVLALVLCDTVSYDTVVVRLAGDTTHRDTTRVGIAPSGSPQGGVTCFPNPVHNELTVASPGLQGEEVLIYDVVGREVKRVNCRRDKEVVDVSDLVNGVYVVQIVDPVTGVRVTKRVVKE